MPDEPEVTYAIINYNGRHLLAELLESVKKQDYPISELLFVDDGSTDGSVEFVSTNHPDVRIVRIEKNTGVPNIVKNIAVRECRTRYIVVSDNDVTLKPDALRNMMKAITTLPNAAICTPRVLFADDPDRISQEAQPMHYICFSTQHNREKLHHEATQVPAIVFGGSNALYDIERIRPFGFNNEELAFGWSDVELPWRLNLAGLATYEVPGAHFYNRRVRDKPRFYAQVRNRLTMIFQMYNGRTLFLIAPALVAFEAGFFAYLAVSGVAGEYVKALRYVISNRSKILARRKAIQATRKVKDRELLVAKPLLVPRSVSASPILRQGVRMLDFILATYWKMVSPLLSR